MGDTFQKRPSGPVSWGTLSINDPQDQCHGGHFQKTTLRTSVMGDTRARMTLRTCTLGDTFKKRPSGPVSWGDKNDPQDQCHGGHKEKNNP